MKYDINAIRNNIQKAISGRMADPDEFKPTKNPSSTDVIKYRFFILPPLVTGDELKSGVVDRGMDNYFLRHGFHWINDRPYPCPRILNGEECPICNYGFELLRQCKDQNWGDERKYQIIRQWMPNTYYMVNIFFTNWKGNPEELRNKVKFYNASKTCMDKWTATLMKDDLGDPEDPAAFGVFFDERNAFQFELAVLKEGRTNGYKTSQFLANNGLPVPMIANADKTPNEKGLAALLKARVNLWSKVEQPEPDKLQRLLAQMIDGDDSGFDQDEYSKKATTPVKSESAPAAQKPKPVVKEEDDLSDIPFEAEEVSTQAAKPKAVQVDADVDSDDIDALLSQLED